MSIEIINELNFLIITKLILLDLSRETQARKKELANIKCDHTEKIFLRFLFPLKQ